MKDDSRGHFGAQLIGIEESGAKHIGAYAKSDSTVARCEIDSPSYLIPNR